MRKHLNPAMVVALIALFVALTGGSYAAIMIPRNSIGAAQIRDGAVASPEIRDRSLLAKDFKTGQLPRGETGASGQRGATGAPGAVGATGAAGAPGPSDLYMAVGPALTEMPTNESAHTGAEIVLPAGNYKVMATLTIKAYYNGSYVAPVFAGNRTEWTVNCFLYPSDVAPGLDLLATVSAGNRLPRIAYDDDLVPMTLDGVLQRDEAGPAVTVRLRCNPSREPANANLELKMINPRMTAIKVESVIDTAQ